METKNVTDTQRITKPVEPTPHQRLTANALDVSQYTLITVELIGNGDVFFENNAKTQIYMERTVLDSTNEELEQHDIIRECHKARIDNKMT